MHSLIGKVVTAIYMSKGEEIIVFDTDQDLVAYQTWGDCCSKTWFSDIYGLDTLLGHLVVAVEDLKLPDYNVDDGRGRQDYDQVYGYKLETEVGYADIVFRNSSNGYYGGTIEQLDRTDQLNPANFYTIEGSDWKA